MDTTALLVIDVQRSFEHMPFWSESSLAPYQHAQNALIAYAREQQWPVLFIYHQSRGAFSMESGHVGPMAWVDRKQGDPVFYKRVHSALGESGVDTWLKCRGITKLVISGIRTEQCCETTTRAAKDAGYEVSFVLDATHTFDMKDSNGTQVDAVTIKNHSALVLDKRFAIVSDLESLKSRDHLESINMMCPRSGGVVSEDSLIEYHGNLVGFCNPGCRDSFASDPQTHVLDRLYFDNLIARQTQCDAYARTN